MPTYEYECTKCGHVVEIFQSIMAKPKRKPDEPCANCGERAPIKRLISRGGALLFKGSGFYETDYRSENYKQAAKAESDSSQGKTDAAKDKPAEKSAEKAAEKPAKSESKPKKSAGGSAGESAGKSKVGV